MKVIRNLTIMTFLGALIYQGLYFTHIWLLWMVFLAILLGVSIYRSKTFILPKDNVFWFLCVYSLWSILSWFFVLEKGMHIFGVLKSLMYLIAYLLIVQLQDTDFVDKFKKYFIYLLALVGYVAMMSYLFGWFSGLSLVINERVAGPLQYANTYGIILIVGVLLLIREDQKLWHKMVLMIGIVIPLILTMSRGSFLVGLVLLGLSFIYERFQKATYITLATSIVIGILILVIVDNTTASRVLETTSASEWQTRLLYYQDGLVMIKDRLMGYGYHGYYYAKNFYRTGSTYHVKFIHSSLIQSFLDLGVIGGLLLGAFMAFVVFLKRYDMNQRIMVMGLLGHSLLDLDLEFPFVWLLVLLLLSTKKASVKVSISQWIPIGLCVLVGFGAAYMSLSSYYLSQGDYAKAIDLYPNYTEAKRKLLREDITLDEKAEVASSIIDCNPYIDASYEVLKEYALSQGNFKEALDFSRAMTYYNPISIKSYEVHSSTMVVSLQYYIATKELDEASLIVAEMLALPESLAQLAKEKNTDYNVKHKPDLEMTEALMKDYVLAGQLSKKLESKDNQ